MRRNDSERKGGFFLALVRGSIILGFLERLTIRIYRNLRTGLFGFIFTGYHAHSRSAFFEWISGTFLSRFLERIRIWLCRCLEESLFARLGRYLVRLLLGCRLKVYGTFAASFGAYTAVVAVIRSIFSGTISGEGLLTDTNILVAFVLILSGLPLIFSKKSLSEALCASLVGNLIRNVTGFTEEDMTVRTDGGHMSTAFLLGMLCGVLTYRVSPVILLVGMAALIAAYPVLVKPEIGVLALFVFMPFLPTMVLLGLEAYIIFCYLLKLFRKKRVFRAEPLDCAAAAFGVLLLAGGYFSVSNASLKEGLLLCGFLCAYFLVVGLIRSAEWLTRCAVGSVISAAVVSLYGLFTYFTGTSVMDDAWVDSEMFGSITGRASGTLGNPNMFGEYLILVIPLAIGMLLRRWSGMKKFTAFVCLCLMGMGLVFSWCRGAMLGLVLAMIVFLFMWHRRAIFLVLGGIASIPFLPMILPESISSRFLNIVNMSDSSTSYRVGGWMASINMMKDNFLAGIGIGGDAWSKIYPQYSFNAMESTPHAHNIYLQLVIELGVTGLVVFLCFIFLLYQSGFTYFARLSDEGFLLPENLSKSDVPASSDPNRNIRRTATDLRISAAAPLCGILGVLAQGMVEHIWYNYRVYLMIWLVTGLASAYIRTGNALLDRCGPVDSDSCGEGYTLDMALPNKKRIPKRRKERS